jgi:hypothetical protein
LARGRHQRLALDLLVTLEALWAWFGTPAIASVTTLTPCRSSSTAGLPPDCLDRVEGDLRSSG